MPLVAALAGTVRPPTAGSEVGDVDRGVPTLAETPPAPPEDDTDVGAGAVDDEAGAGPPFAEGDVVVVVGRARGEELAVPWVPAEPGPAAAPSRVSDVDELCATPDSANALPPGNDGIRGTASEAPASASNGCEPAGDTVVASNMPAIAAPVANAPSPPIVTAATAPYLASRRRRGATSRCALCCSFIGRSCLLA